MENALVYLTGVLGIVVVDLVLSGDNALVIGMAARQLPPRQRRLAILVGGGASIGLRVLFAAMASLLLAIPLLEAAGGIVLLWIAWKLLRSAHPTHAVAAGVTFLASLRTIILADVVMSLDNILAVAGVAHGSVALLLFGLGLSMPLVLFGSGLIAVLMARVPSLVFLGSGVLAWTSGQMIVGDDVVGQILPDVAFVEWLIPLLLTGVLLIASVRNASLRRGSRTTTPIL